VSGFVRELRCLAGAGTGAIARALSREPGLSVLASDPRGALAPSDARFSFVAASPVETSTAWLPPAWPPTNGRVVSWAGFPAAPRWVGTIPYDAGRGLERHAWTRTPDPRPRPFFAEPRWQRFDAVVRIDHATGIVAIEGDDAFAVDALARRVLSGLRRGDTKPERFALAMSAAVEPDARHEDRVRAALELIASGDIYQVNLARRIACTVKGDRLALFRALFRVAPATYGFFADLAGVTVCASSPELALEVRGDSLRTAPMKGTRPRGGDAQIDSRNARELDADEKERAELTMAIDLHRNDLGRVGVPGSVRLLGAPRILTGRTVMSRSAEIVARKRPDATIEDVVRSMLPCGSVTGAPKVRAMEIIAALEPYRRGLYTGAFGYVGRDGGLVLAVAIRTLEISQSGIAHFGTGGGIVADSDPARELEETRWKSAQLRTLESWPQNSHSSNETWIE
jgi:anthranilate/para-aminobenzoate synthase component I